ncbi:MAG: YlmC/YmxH family sporulation protein [Oscillospiraceae bacterium]
MQCRIAELRCKEVINVCSGFRLGFVSDVVFDVVSGQLLSIVVPGPYKFLGLFGRSDDYIIPWESIRKIGDDIILVEAEGEQRREKRPKKQWV